MVMVCGGGVLPWIQGLISGSGAGYLASYWVIVAALAYLLIYAVFGSKPEIKKQ